MVLSEEVKTKMVAKIMDDAVAFDTFISMKDAFGISEARAAVEYINNRFVGKHVVAEARNDKVSRLYLCDNGLFNNGMNLGLSSFFKLYTLSTDAVNKGKYICRVSGVRTDKNGYVNLIVTPVKFISPDWDSHALYSSKHTWDSMVWWFFREVFVSEYIIKMNSGFININYLKENAKFLVEKAGDNSLGKTVFDEWVAGNISLTFVEDCIYELPKDEKMIRSLIESYQNGNIRLNYSDDYPILVEKLVSLLQDTESSLDHYDIVKNYLNRNVVSYYKLFTDGAEGSNVLAMVERVLLYRVEERVRQKEERKAKRKASKG